MHKKLTYTLCLLFIWTWANGTPPLSPSLCPHRTEPTPQKWALIIAIGDYEKTQTGWPSISAANDIPLIKYALVRQAFPEENISVLQDEAANRMGIVRAINRLGNKVQPGDMVLIHYSGHGQQIYDDNGDEPDGLDEALVAFGAPSSCIDNPNCSGAQHVRDDELGILMTQLREKVGTEGHVVLSLDACHSGTGTRGGYAKARGGMPPLMPPGFTLPEQPYQLEKGFGMHETTVRSRSNEPGLGKFVLFAGAGFDERNYETKDENGNPVGSLSYALSKTLTAARPEDTYRSLFAKLMAIMAEKSPYQSPVLEGEVDHKLFGGEVIPQTPYFTITNVKSNQEIQISGGLISGATVGSQVALYKSGTTSPEATKNVLASGEIIRAENFLSTIFLHEPLPLLEKNPKSVWVFVTQPFLVRQALHVNLEGVQDANQQAALKAQLSTSKRLKISPSQSADLYVLSEVSQSNPYIIQTSDDAIPCANAEECREKMEVYAKGNFIKSLKPENANYLITMELIPVQLDDQKNVEATLAMDDFLNEGNVPCLPEGSFYKIKVKHTGTERAYYNIIDIQPDGYINPVLPAYDTEYYVDYREFFLEPGEARLLPYHVEIGPPYGVEVFKVFTDKQPVNLEHLFVSQHRGMEETAENIGGSSFDYVFKIVPH